MLREVTTSQIVNNQAVVSPPVKHPGNGVIHVDNSGCSHNTKTIIVYYIQGLKDWERQQISTIFSIKTNWERQQISTIFSIKKITGDRKILTGKIWKYDVKINNWRKEKY